MSQNEVSTFRLKVAILKPKNRHLILRHKYIYIHVFHLQPKIPLHEKGIMLVHHIASELIDHVASQPDPHTADVEKQHTLLFIQLGRFLQGNVEWFGKNQG